MSRKDHRFTESPVLKDQLASWRIHFVSALIFGALLALVGRAFYLQMINEDFLQARGDVRYRRVLEIPASRGKILDRHGDMLAQSTPMRAVWATADAKLDKEQLKDLGALLEMDPRQIEKKLNGDKSFVYLKHQVSPDAAARIAALKLPGIQIDREYSRFYPAGDMVAHMVGFTGKDDRGQEGVELAFESRLIGANGERTVIKDRRGQIVEEIGSERPPQDGEDIQLAIDSKIQFIAFNALRNAADKFNAKGGSVIVADIKTGEILALANWPTYNPNNRSQLSGGQLRNRAVTDSFEPGSTMKPFMAALALDRGKYKFDSIINCAPGKMTIGTATISDAHPHGALTLAQVIQKSSNIGATKIALGFPPEEMWTMMSKAGFGKSTGLGFPGEVGGRLRPWQTWKPIEQATMSYGHGVSVTVVQLAHAYTAFARDGDAVQLSLLKTNGAVSSQSVFAPETARQVRLMLEMVVSPEGTANKAAVPGYRVGGKTGTAHKLVGGRYANKYLASFVGIGPISDPRLVVGVVVDEPVGAHYGGDVAGPVFSEVMGGALRTLGVPQDKESAPAALKATPTPAPAAAPAAVSQPAKKERGALMLPLSTREDVLSWVLAQGLRPTGVCADSRRVRAGDIFVAEVPESGARAVYARDALANGACAVLWAADLPLCEAEFGSAPVVAVAGLHALVGPIAQQVYGNPSEQMRVVAVTGTNGKTTVTQWLAQTMPGRCAVIGTLGAGYPDAMVETGFTTPDAAQYAHLLSDFVEDGATACAVEASSIGIEEARMAGSAVDCAVFTNLTRDHLDYHQTMAAYAAAKAKLFVWEGLRAVVINYDDAFGQTLCAQTTAKLVVAYGLSARPAALAASVAWVGASSVQTTAQGMSATLIFGDECLPFATQIIGRHNLSNLLAVAAVLVAQGLSPAEIVVELAKLLPPAGRMACLGGNGQPLIVVDYAHTPDALANILMALRDVTRARGGKLVCVFGCGGDRDPGKRPEMGRAAAAGADTVCITSDNPRWESAAEILNAIAAGAPAAQVIEDRAQAIAQMITHAAAEDVVLLAGKGHETEQEIRGQRYPFDDAVHAKDALAAWHVQQSVGAEA